MILYFKGTACAYCKSVLVFKVEVVEMMLLTSSCL